MGNNCDFSPSQLPCELDFLIPHGVCVFLSFKLRVRPDMTREAYSIEQFIPQYMTRTSKVPATNISHTPTLCQAKCQVLNRVWN